LGSKLPGIDLLLIARHLLNAPEFDEAGCQNAQHEDRWCNDENLVELVIFLRNRVMCRTKTDSVGFVHLPADGGENQQQLGQKETLYRSGYPILVLGFRGEQG
jgi:hypothetical protein